MGVLGRQAQTRPSRATVLLVLLAATCSRSSGRDRAATPRTKGEGVPAADEPARREGELPLVATLPLFPEAPGANPARGGTLRVHLEGEPPHLNPLQDAHPSIARVVDKLIYETLLECRGDRYLPALAESWELAPDGTRVVLHMRGGVRWHDDRPFTAIDVQASLEAVLRGTSRVPVLRGLLGDVTAVEVLGDRAVRLKLDRGGPLALRALCEIPILPEAAIRGGRPETTQLARQPVGTGPFRLAAWERGKRIRLVRFPAAWRGPAHLDEIVFEIDTDSGRALGRIRRGDLDSSAPGPRGPLSRSGHPRGHRRARTALAAEPGPVFVSRRQSQARPAR